MVQAEPRITRSIVSRVIEGVWYRVFLFLDILNHVRFLFFLIILLSYLGLHSFRYSTLYAVSSLSLLTESLGVTPFCEVYSAWFGSFYLFQLAAQLQKYGQGSCIVPKPWIFHYRSGLYRLRVILHRWHQPGRLKTCFVLPTDPNKTTRPFSPRYKGVH
jgi:hypothetical protein